MLRATFHLAYLFFALAFLVACEQQPPENLGFSESHGFVENQTPQQNEADSDATQVIDNRDIESAFANKKSDVLVQGQGVVIKLLADDTKGAQHQKFLVRINPQQTLLFAHNIDLAPRVPIQVSDSVRFQGEYVYNPKGGIVHWTHHDPKGNHPGGWIKHHGQTYQ